MRGIEILLDVINDKVRGIDITPIENLIIEVRDFNTNNIVNSAQITITGSLEHDGVYNVGELNLYQVLPQAINISATASGYDVDNAVINHSGEGSYFTVTLIIEKVQTDFMCDIETENEGGSSLNKNLSESENTVVKAIFTTTNLSIPNPLLYKCIIRQWSSIGTSDEGVVEIDNADVQVVSNSLVYSIILTPSQVANIGDRITARIIEL